jgi:hypothetical protein
VQKLSGLLLASPIFYCKKVVESIFLQRLLSLEEGSSAARNSLGTKVQQKGESKSHDRLLRRRNTKSTTTSAEKAAVA